MSSKVINNPREYITAINQAIEKMFPEHFRFFLLLFWHNIDIIEESAESPIESRLFKAMCFNNPTRFMFLKPTRNINESIIKLREIIGDDLDYDKLGVPGSPEFTKSLEDFYNCPEMPYDMELLNDSLSAYSDIAFHMDFYFSFLNSGSFVFIQSSIVMNGAIIRPDMLIWHPRTDFRLIVECDGFEYHNNKESFIKDRTRDRWFTKNNFHVMRFSGAELTTNAESAAKEIHQFLESSLYSVIQNIVD